MRHKWNPYKMSWQYFDLLGAYRAEQCQHCGCIKFHCKLAQIHTLKYLQASTYTNTLPTCTGSTAEATPGKKQELSTNKL